MTFDSLNFALFCALAILSLNLARRRTPRLWVLLGLSALFIATYTPTVVALLPLAGLVVVGYGAILLARRSRGLAFAAMVVAVVLLFIWIKRYTIVGFLPRLPFDYLLVGTSFILFRILHLVIDIHQNDQEIPRPLDYLAYLLSFFTFVSGPIQRYEDFSAQIAESQFARSAADIHSAVSRIIVGVLLVAVITKLTFYVFGHMQPRLYALIDMPGATPKLALFFAATAMVYAVHLYLNFAGYMEIVVGVGALCGFQLPENFDRPYLSDNFLDLWSRWHITLSNWIKYYIFNPLLLALSRRWGSSRSGPYLGVLAYFVAFLVIGLWHGSTFLFLVYGLCLGFGVAINKLYQIEATRALGRQRYRALTQRHWYRYLSRAVTLGYFALAVACVWIAPQSAALLLSARGVMAIAIAFALSVGAVIVLCYVCGWLSIPVLALQRAFTGASLSLNSGWRAPLWSGAKLFTVINAAVIVGGQAPEFVYKAF